MYQQIYSDNHELDYALQNKIVLTYAGFIEFCIKTTQYYKGTGRSKHFAHVLNKVRNYSLNTVQGGGWLRLASRAPLWTL